MKLSSNRNEVSPANFTGKYRGIVIAVPVLIFLILIIAGTVNQEAFIGSLNAFFQVLMVNGSWVIGLGTLAFVAFMIFILIHPIGSIKLGGEDAKPDFSLWNWFAISLCAGVGTGIVFWGPIEPLLFTVAPQLSAGLESGSSEAAIWALGKSYLHWSFAPYATYAVFGVIIAFAYYNLHKGFSVSSGFAPLLGKKTDGGRFKDAIDTLTVFAITGGMAGSLGYGLLQISSGLNTVFGIPAETMTFVLVCAVIVVAYTVSSITGIDRGIRWLSDKNAWLFLSLMVLAFVFGPAQWVCNLLTESVGAFISSFVSSITAVSPFSDAGTVVGNVWYEDSELWPQWWDQYYFVDFLSFGPIVGLFSIRLAKGRTLRQFVIMNWFVPAAFAILWFAVFGGLALDIQYNYSAYADRVDLAGCATLYDYMQVYGNEAMMLKVIEAIPFAWILKPIVLIVIVLSFVTMADSVTSTISLMTLKDSEGVREAPSGLKLMWGVVIGAAALVFTLSGSIEGIKIIKTIAGFPILILGLTMMVMFLIAVSKKRYVATEVRVSSEAMGLSENPRAQSGEEDRRLDDVVSKGLASKKTEEQARECA